MSYLLLYVPIAVATLALLELAREVSPKELAKRVGKNLAVITAVLAVAGALAFLLDRM